MRAKLIKLTAAFAVVVAILATTISSASAATATLTVTTLGRNGGNVYSQVAVMNLAQGWAQANIPSGHPVVLPPGKYAVMVDIKNRVDGTETIGASVISLGIGPRSITVDARNGHALAVNLDTNPDPSYSRVYVANICAGNERNYRLNVVSAPGKLYVIPNSSSALQFAYLEEWLNPAQTEAYVVDGLMTGVPGSLDAVVPRSSLATWNATVRHGPAIGPEADLRFYPYSDKDESCKLFLGRFVHDQAPTPFTVSVHASADTWNLQSDDLIQDGGVGAWSRERTLTPGALFSQTYFSAPWGPAHQPAYVYQRQVRFDAVSMVADPSAFGSESSADTTATLSFGGKILSTQHLVGPTGPSTAFGAPISKIGWYTLNLSTTRSSDFTTLPPDLLSPTSTVNFRFWGNPNTVGILPVYFTRFVPAVLNLNNTAAPGTATTVALVPDRETTDAKVRPLSSVPITKIQAWWSNDGKTWTSTPVTHSGSTWSTVITNPASGYVSLRATITNNSGISTTTIDRAYAVGQLGAHLMPVQPFCGEHGCA